ncbi:hypothetical protein [Microbaculum marinum]|uniref:Uncharacterized protein n=1 Tax=Microbaculum marinum TaxID=1764581 RepID=A0AAW9RSL5_9HYPH
MISVTLHDVTSVELCREFVTNRGSRTLRITCADGATLEIHCFGETVDLTALRRSADFRDIGTARHGADEAA